MKTYRPKKGPFRERPYYSDSEIENTCADELRAVGLYPATPSAVRIDRFIEKRFGVTPTYEDLGKKILGFTKFGVGGVKEVVIASALEEEDTVTAERRIRSTMAHEAGHGIFHSHLFVLGAQERPLFGDFSDPSAPKILCRDEVGQSSGYKGQWWEYQANRAIGAFLLPKALVEEMLAPFCVKTGLLGYGAFDESRREVAVALLANTFEVNPAVARIRLEQVFPQNKSGQLQL
jgi:hypothetical protein